MYQYTCLSCQKQFSSFDSKRKYCSFQCYNIHKTNDYNFKCKWCNKGFRGKLKKGKLSKFCSKLCFHSYSKNPEKLFNSMKNHYEKYIIKNDNDCWGWKGPFAKNGYALSRYNRKVQSASRISWMIHKGSIPEHIFVLHKCDNPPCTNPDHLFLGTHNDNMQDKIKKGRSNNPKGSKHYKATLTEDQVIDIKLRLSNGEKIVSIAKYYNVTRPTISCIKYGVSWKNLI